MFALEEVGQSGGALIHFCEWLDKDTGFSKEVSPFSVQKTLAQIV